MPHDVDISVGADTSAAATGLAELRNFGLKARGELESIFAKTLAFGGIIAGIQSVIDKAHDLHHEAERFGVDAAGMQVVSNAAKEMGISVESVARAMNRAEIAGYKAAQGGKAQTEALAALNLDVKEFNALNPSDKILAVADAWNEAGDKTAAYNAVATIFGARFGTEMIPLLSKGSAEIRKLSEEMGILSDKEIEIINKIYEARNKALSHLNVFASEFLAQEDLTLKLWGAQWDRFWSYWKGDEAAHKAALEQVDKIKQAAQTLNQPSAAKPFLTPAERASTDSAFRSEGAGGGGASAETLQARLDKLHEDAAARQRTDEEQLNALKQKQNDLIQEQARLVLEQGGDEEAALKNDIARAENLKAQDDLQTKITDDQDKSNKLANEARQQAEQMLSDQKEQNKELEAQRAGKAWLVDSLRKEYEYDQKIKEISDQINEAWSEGNTELAQTLTDLKDELATEQKITREIDAQNAAKKKLNDAQAAREQAAGKFNQSRSGISGEQQQQLQEGLAGQQNWRWNPNKGKYEYVEGGKSQEEIARLGGAGTGVAELGKDVTWTDEALLMATDASTGKVDPQRLTYYRALADRAFREGKQAFSVQDIMGRQKALLALSQKQGLLDTEQARQQNLAGIRYDEAVMSGSFSAPQLAQAFPQFAPPINVSTVPESGQVQQLQTQIGLMQQQLDRLTAIDTKLATTPASSTPAAVLSGLPATNSQITAALRALLAGG